MPVLAKTDLAAKADAIPTREQALRAELLAQAARSLTSAGVGNVTVEDLHVQRWGVLTLSVTFTVADRPAVRYLKQNRLFGMSPAVFTKPVREGAGVLDRKALLRRLAQ